MNLAIDAGDNRAVPLGLTSDHPDTVARSIGLLARSQGAPCAAAPRGHGA